MFLICNLLSDYMCVVNFRYIVPFQKDGNSNATIKVIGHVAARVCESFNIFYVNSFIYESLSIHCLAFKYHCFCLVAV